MTKDDDSQYDGKIITTKAKEPTILFAFELNDDRVTTACLWDWRQTRRTHSDNNGCTRCVFYMFHLVRVADAYFEECCSCMQQHRSLISLLSVAPPITATRAQHSTLHSARGRFYNVSVSPCALLNLVSFDCRRQKGGRSWCWSL